MPLPFFLLVAFGLAFLTLGWALTRSFGSALRIGRLLSTAPQVTLEEALEMAAQGRPAYVRVFGRIDTPEPFLDEHGRPLVLRRERIEVREGQAWRTLRQERREVPFVVRDRGAEIAIEGEALDDGLVVLPREAVGRASEIAELIRGPFDPGLVLRFRVDQVSAVEHAFAAGVPQRSADGTVRLGHGLGRPLVLTTLEIPEAMRVLAEGRRGRARAAALLLAAGIACFALALLLALATLVSPASVLAASPEPTVAPGGDTRSSGGGPGLVGQPFVALAGVLALGLLSAILAALYARLAGPRRKG